MVLSIYFEPLSQPSRSVVLFAKCAGIQHEPMLTSLNKVQQFCDIYVQKSGRSLVPN